MRQNGHRGPAGESQILTETSDKEIHQAVMDSITARENLDINSGDDVDDALRAGYHKP
jgi:hypothetical protein